MEKARIRAGLDPGSPLALRRAADGPFAGLPSVGFSCAAECLACGA